MNVPILETERLTLGPHSRAGFDAYKSVQCSDRAQYMDGELTPMEAWNAFTSEAGSWVIDGFGYWTATRKDTGEAVAFVGILQPPHFPEVELGWLVTQAAEGKGYAFEAAQAARAWGFGDRGLDTLVSYISPENARSIALAERLGAVRDTRVQGSSPKDLVYRHPHPGAA
ncbi:MAG: GNAT family N-acetyltransferase [Pseudomonadota bacterium]